MAFQVKYERGATVVVVNDPRLAAAVRALGYMWDDVKDQPIAEGVLAEMIDALEQLSERFPSVLSPAGERNTVPGTSDTWFAEI